DLGDRAQRERGRAARGIRHRSGSRVCAALDRASVVQRARKRGARGRQERLGRGLDVGRSRPNRHPGVGQRTRCPCTDPRCDLRAVLHDQGPRQGHRTWPAVRACDHDPTRWHPGGARAARSVRVCIRASGRNVSRSSRKSVCWLPSPAIMSEPVTKGPLVLYVDDERGNRVVFETSMKAEFNVRVASEPQEALEILEANDVAVIVTDMRMPTMSGEELLRIAKERWPQSIRMVVTAYSDIDPILRAINEGLVARYIIKPWVRTELMQVLRWATEAWAMGRDNA